MNNQLELFQRLIDSVDNETVRIEIANTLPELALLSERNVYKFKELLEKYMQYNDGRDAVSQKWKIIYQNCFNFITFACVIKLVVLRLI